MALCLACHGKGVLCARMKCADAPSGYITVPCPECGGHGVIACCDGLREQPEPARKDDGGRRA